MMECDIEELLYPINKIIENDEKYTTISDKSDFIESDEIFCNSKYFTSLEKFKMEKQRLWDN